MADEPKAESPDESASDALSVDEDAARGPGYRVELPGFEGPLDLLLHLIQQHELDVMNIPIGFVTEKYLEYLTLMQELNIDVASEYLVMAATLAHIKSKMLLPTPPEDQEDEAESDLDPRAELVRRLLEYQKYKLAAEQLGSRHVLGRDVFLRGMPAPMVDGPAPFAPVGLFTLLDAFQAVLQRAKRVIDHQIDFDRVSISDKINTLSDLLRVKRRLLFEELFTDQQSRAELIVTFLALLEMTRLRMTRVSQDGPFDPITIELAVTDDDTVASPGETEGDAATEASEQTELEYEPGFVAAVEGAEASPEPPADDEASPAPRTSDADSPALEPAPDRSDREADSE